MWRLVGILGVVVGPGLAFASRNSSLDAFQGFIAGVVFSAGCFVLFADVYQKKMHALEAAVPTSKQEPHATDTATFADELLAEVEKRRDHASSRR